MPTTYRHVRRLVRTLVMDQSCINVHNQISIPAAMVFFGIDKELRNIISARRHRKHFDSFMAMWLR
ncbi:hypothetical protein IGI04_024348 [Brassica rapa subsp. trilocularis]|uniref:Uncharacterized protein n=1 Tax=Brassica rapa subsp. trilocularis TaxID=1813537 RepID=A0ABQ7M7T3_BRACM|nr:hypothetical protein IGI04_024348 [Brassica rapa subsp. trilocularis]